MAGKVAKRALRFAGACLGGGLADLLLTTLASLRRWRLPVFSRWAQAQPDDWSVPSDNPTPVKWVPVLTKWERRTAPERRLAERLPEGARAVTAIRQDGTVQPGIVFRQVAGLQ
jgi:hypothetical protein